MKKPLLVLVLVFVLLLEGRACPSCVLATLVPADAPAAFAQSAGVPAATEVVLDATALQAVFDGAARITGDDPPRQHTATWIEATLRDGKLVLILRTKIVAPAKGYGQ
jgi:hypothetical protein